MGVVTVGLCYLPTSEKMYVTIETVKDLMVMDRGKESTGKYGVSMEITLHVCVVFFTLFDTGVLYKYDPLITIEHMFK